MIRTYVKKPVVVNAVEFNSGMGDEIVEWIKHSGGDASCSNGKIYIYTLEGTMMAGVGDFIIKGIAGEFYPCKPEIFYKTYQLAE